MSRSFKKVLILCLGATLLTLSGCFERSVEGSYERISQLTVPGLTSEVKRVYRLEKGKVYTSLYIDNTLQYTREGEYSRFENTITFISYDKFTYISDSKTQKLATETVQKSGPQIDKFALAKSGLVDSDGDIYSRTHK